MSDHEPIRLDDMHFEGPNLDLPPAPEVLAYEDYEDWRADALLAANGVDTTEQGLRRHVLMWGAVNEWTAQAGYGQLSRRADHPVLTELLKRIMRQEGRHIDFYAAEATRRLGESPAAQRVVRWALRRLWRPGPALLRGRRVLGRRLLHIERVRRRRPVVRGRWHLHRGRV